MRRWRWHAVVLLLAALPAVLFATLDIAGADRGLAFLSGQAVTYEELRWALGYLTAYAAFVLFTPPLVLSAVLEPLIAKLLDQRERKA